MVRNRLLAFAMVLLVTSASSRGADSLLDFQSQVAPILQRHCIRCHSPNNNQGELSLATLDDLRANDYVIAGDPESSYLLELITPTDGQPAAMPKESNPLSDAEVALIRQWIVQGATWPSDVVVKERSKADETWWALQPLRVAKRISSDSNISDAPLPPASIDEFVRGKLADKQLKMNPPADRRTLIRRVTFDLIGLPPTPQDVESFVDDSDPMAYEKLVDRLLASPHYGERYARHWLDLAHYADTHGFERDMRRDNAWRYRDYVIESFNEDKPYDRFVQEQIAGDVLWPDDDQAVIATGFLSAGPWDFVGQVETKSDQLRRSARVLDLDDMTTQVMTTTMAMTVNCARCHDHKLDPISQREYYQLQSVFAGVRREARVVSDSSLKAYESAKQQWVRRRNQIDFELARLEGDGLDLADIVGGGNGSGTGTFRQGIDVRNAKVQTRDFGRLGNVVPNRFAASDFDFVDGVFVPSGEAGQAKVPVTSTGITISGLPTTSGDAWDMIRNGPVASQHSPELDGIDFTQDGHSLLGLHANAGITFDLSAIRQSLADGAAETSPGMPLRFTAQLGYFGASGPHRADAWVFVDGRNVAEFKQLGREDGLQPIDLELSAAVRFLTLVSTDGGNGMGHDQIGFGDPRIRPKTSPTRSDADAHRIETLRGERDQVTAELDALGPPPRFYGVVAEKDLPEVRLLTRGNPETPSGDVLPPSALSALAMLDPELGTVTTDEGQRRVALARWITSIDNPLVRRVIVNRLWYWHFGQGLVDTPSDFGFGGGRPSHPELLDWLAEALVHHDWSLKAMHRLIVTSDTYKQSSRHREPAAKVDAENRLLWRQNRQRIEAEAIRDAVLFVSGKLNLRRGGPGFEDFDYQDAYAPIYTYTTADRPELWRRSIYRYIVRTTPDRFLTTLDCPDPANLTPKRITTTTPLQSLALFNNDFMLRQARYFAQRIGREAGTDPAAQVDRAFALALGRQPSQQEAQLATEFVDRQGLFALCRSLFNLNEFVYVD
ncbi:DUF1553 domain-containing protein [Stieleria sp. ICT_E10.1]|uniref:DUF1553 domain-containing protein n=1 Tax=Stieleria sedimenti TaxID=2976331 RepID=UPI00218041D1|nr:DUF1553 domain-containing protein [Stieleria sedimenti]MCS7469377.1 DUF1553 domain-containing protein [Stieleria sedimenti]